MKSPLANATNNIWYVNKKKINIKTQVSKWSKLEIGTSTTRKENKYQDASIKME